MALKKVGTKDQIRIDGFHPNFRVIVGHYTEGFDPLDLR